MITTFAEIYARFSNKITDYILLELSDQDAVDLMYGYLVGAIAKLRDVRAGSFEYTDDNVWMNEDGEEEIVGPHFLNALIETEKALLTLGMIEEWLDPQINSVLNTRQFISSKETNFFAQHNHLNGLIHLQKETKHERDYLLTQYKTLHNDYLETTESVT